MENELVVKDNALINASYNLETTEQRLVILAIIIARETGAGITAESKLQIHASDYAKQFNVTKEAAYSSLKNAVTNLFNRQFSYSQYFEKTDKVEIVKSRWVSKISYVEDLAILRITFAPDVVPLITKLECHFTSYQLKQVTQLSSKYAIRLYELLIAWRGKGKTPVFQLEDLRFKLGLKEGDYPRIDTLKRRVLDQAVKQINHHTDIETNYEQFKNGRVVAGIRFSFKEKKYTPPPQQNKKDADTPDMFTGLTEKQIRFFAHKLAYENAFASQYAQVGEEYQDVEERLVNDLSKAEFIEKNINYLRMVGFK